MAFPTGPKGRAEDIIELFISTFTASEGIEEGALIGNLARNLLAGTAEKDLFVFTAEEDGKLIGNIVFSRLTYEQDDRMVFVLAPVAVATDRQGQGIGLRLLKHGLAALHPGYAVTWRCGLDNALTCGSVDPVLHSPVSSPGVADVARAVARSVVESWVKTTTCGLAKNQPI